MRRAAVLLLVSSCSSLSGCVIGRSTRATQVEAAQGPLAPSVTGSPVVPQTVSDNDERPPDKAPADKAKQGFVWVRGYWHWDGVRYEWQRGHWQPP